VGKEEERSDGRLLVDELYGLSSVLAPADGVMWSRYRATSPLRVGEPIA